MLSSIPQNFFPALNACLNAMATLLLLLGYILVKNRRFEAHRKIMWSAFGVSALFLISYLYYHFNFSSNRFAGVGAIRYFYFAMLISHIILAVGILPFILRLLYVAQKGAFEKHKKLARWVWPIWIYNSVTGVLIYFMLYHWYPGVPLEAALP